MNRVEVKIRLVPDSVRWLLSRGRLADAKKVIKRAAKINRTEINDEVMDDWENGQKSRVVNIQIVKAQIECNGSKFCLFYIH
jgi:phage gp45-like